MPTQLDLVLISRILVGPRGYLSIAEEPTSILSRLCEGPEPSTPVEPQIQRGRTESARAPHL